MWQVAFSSKSVLKKVMPVWPTRDSPSTSATSPSRVAEARRRPSALRTASAPVEARHLDALAAREPQLEVADDRCRRARAGGSSGRFPRSGASRGRRRPLRSAGSGRARCRLASRSPRRPSATPGTQADREIGARPREADGVELERVELRAAVAGACRRGPATTATGSGSSSRTDSRDRLPEPLDVRLAEHLQRLPLGREGGDRPVDQPFVRPRRR